MRSSPSTPVSYTHLDVYKRQGQFRALEGSKPFIGQVGSVEQFAEWKVEMVVADELIPVSYTHLDVYKRQA